MIREQQKLASMPEIGAHDASQVGLGIVDSAIRLVDNHMHFVQLKNNCTHS